MIRCPAAAASCRAISSVPRVISIDASIHRNGQQYPVTGHSTPTPKCILRMAYSFCDRCDGTVSLSTVRGRANQP
jgi:hypothetical protein